MNKVILAGRLTKDVELRYTPNGVAVASFTVAVNRRFKQEGQPEADFIQCVVWQKPAENTANFVGKGCRVEIIGRWNTRSFEGQDGKRVYVNECVVEEITFVDFVDRGDGQANPNQGQQQQQGGQQQRQNNQGNTNGYQGQQNRGGGQNGGNEGGYNRNQNDPFANQGGQIDISDDDLPF